MNPRNLGIVYRKELRDILRDRRTLTSMIIVPLFILPLLIAGLGLLGVQQVKAALQQTERIMILGGDDSPKALGALRQLRHVEFVPADPAYQQMIVEKKIGAAVEIPPDFDALLETGAPATIHIYDYEGELKSETAASTLSEHFQKWRDATVQARLAAHGLAANLLHPFEIQTANVAPSEKVSGNQAGAFLPYVLLMMCVAGAIYPAIDLTAGEKERGTMETILSSPVERSDLALGKCLVVVTASLTTMTLALTSASVSFLLVRHFGANFVRNSGLVFDLQPSMLLGVFALMVPMALLFGSVLLAAGLYARGTREANSYLQPLMLLVLFPAMLSLLPGFELNYYLALIPVVNVTLLSKEFFSGTWHWNYIAVVLGSSCVYAAASLGVAVALFKREAIIFRA